MALLWLSLTELQEHMPITKTIALSESSVETYKRTNVTAIPTYEKSMLIKKQRSKKKDRFYKHNLTFSRLNTPISQYFSSFRSKKDIGINFSSLSELLKCNTKQISAIFLQ